MAEIRDNPPGLLSRLTAQERELIQREAEEIKASPWFRNLIARLQQRIDAGVRH